MTSLRQLRNDYRAICRQAPRDMTREELQTAIDARLAQNARVNEESIRREVKAAADKAEREARIADRADHEAWMERKADWNTDDGKLQSLARRMKGWVDDEATTKAGFLASLESDPVSALSWSNGYFLAVAQGRVAREVAASIFEGGATYAQVMDHATRQALRAIRYPARSTNPNSNLIEEALGSAWAEVTDNSFTFG